MADYLEAWQGGSETLEQVEARIHDRAPDLHARAETCVDGMFLRFPFMRPEPGAKVLEVGPGLGYVMQALVEKTGIKKVVGLDAAEGMIRHARRRLRRDGLSARTYKFQHYDGQTFPFEADSFDFIYSVSALQHVPKPASYAILGEIIRCLKPGAAAFIHLLHWRSVTENGHSLTDEIAGQLGGGQHHWHHFYETTELDAVFKAYGGVAQYAIEDGSIWMSLRKPSADDQPSLPLDLQPAPAIRTTRSEDARAPATADTVFSRFSGVSDKEWLDVLKRSQAGGADSGVALPGFPPATYQERTTGLSGDATLEEAFRFYSIAKAQAAKHGNAIGPGSRVLDFGCAWGRITRFFAKDVPTANIFGVDVDDVSLAYCGSTGVPGRFERVAPRGPSPFPDNAFDVIVSYSVFTHLPEDVHRLWAAEFSRILRPGGVVVATMQPRRWLEALNKTPADDPSPWKRALAKHGRNVERHVADFDAGRLVFLHDGPARPGSQPVYGDAAAPLAFIERAWSGAMTVRDYIDDETQIWQAVVSVQKTGRHHPAAPQPPAPSPPAELAVALERSAQPDEIAAELAKAAGHLAAAIDKLSGIVGPNVRPAMEPVQLLPKRDSRAPAADDARRRAALEIVRPPAHYYVDIGNLCNLRCPFCPTGAKTSKTPSGFMSVEAFRTIHRKISPFAKLVSLYNWGEPLLHKDLLEIIAVSAATTPTHIDTNLTTRDFSPEFAEAIVKSGLTSLFASIDGVTQEVYEKYRVRGKLDRAFRNLEALIEAKKRLRSETPHLGWLYHVSRFNEHEIDAAREKAAAIGVPIVFKRLSSPEPAWWSSLHFDADMVLQDDGWFSQLYQPERNPDLDGVELHDAVKEPCRQLFETMTIQWNGDVLPCTCVEGPDYAMGNMITDDFMTVWNGWRFQGSRRFVLNYGPEQNTGSVCEKLDCPVQCKSLTGKPLSPPSAPPGR